MTPKPVYDPSEDSSYKSVTAGDIATLEIFPPVGIARLGDSDKEYFFAPEVPGNISPPAPDGNFRDDQQKIRRQAARFRVYAYDKKGSLLGEVNCKNGYRLTWTVHVANKKGSFTKFKGRYKQVTGDRRNPDVDSDLPLDKRSHLIVDPNEKTIVYGLGPQIVKLEGEFYGSKDDPTTVYLGELHVDGTGRLVFLGGRGYSQSVADVGKPQPEVISEFDSTDWVDDTSDGWVSVKVTATKFSKSSGHKATILCAPSKFAWGVYMPTTLYDIMEDIYDQKNKPNRTEDEVDVEFYTRIYPVLLATYTLSWTNNKALEGHGPFGKGNFLSPDVKKDLISTTTNNLKNEIFRRLRAPDYRNKDQAVATYMPRLSGDNGDMPEPGEISEDTDPIKRFAALTKLQYDCFKAWKDGKFSVVEPKRVTKIEDVNLSDQPRYLTRAHLELTIGDPLYPGIEMWWLAKLPDTYDFECKLDPPFRVNHDTILPGHLTRGLSLPWQADFDLCNTHWWPAVRPDIVVTKADYEETMKRGSGTAEQKLAIATTTRRNWTRGLRDTTNYISYPGSTDMVKFWSYLGFVKQYPGTDPPVYLESERRKLPNPT